MLQSLLGDAGGAQHAAPLQPLKQLLIQHTQGNPFFLEESVRILVETQVLVGERGAYRLAGALPSLQVPATVQAVLAARIDRLPPEEKQLLQTAAAIGAEVPLVLLQAVAEVPESEYTFKHALTQQVAYETLLQERRRALHARIYICFQAPQTRVETIRVSDELIVDLAPDGTIYGLEILNANE